MGPKSGIHFWVRCLSAAMFLFFSNRLGCTGSILVSALATLAVLWLMGVL